MDFDKPHGGRAPRVFYPLRRGVLITEEWFCAQQRRVAVNDVGQVGWRQSSTVVTRRVALRIIGIEMGLVVTVAFLATTFGGPSFLAYALAGAHLVGVTLVTWYSAYRYPGPLQLWAEVRGQPRLLHSSSEQTEFHKIRRALARAVEYKRDLAQLR